MGFTQHLAVFDVTFSALAPRRDMVGVHFAKTPNFAFVGVMSDGAERAVRYTLPLCFGSLLCINRPFGHFIKNSHIKQFRINRAAKNILKNTAAVFLHTDRHTVSAPLPTLSRDHTLFCDIAHTSVPTQARAFHSPHQ